MQKRCVIWLLVIVFYYAYAPLSGAQKHAREFCDVDGERMTRGENKTVPPCTLYMCDERGNFGFMTCTKAPEFDYCNANKYFRFYPLCCEVVCLRLGKRYEKENLKKVKDTVYYYRWFPEMKDLYLHFFGEPSPWQIQHEKEMEKTYNYFVTLLPDK